MTITTNPSRDEYTSTAGQTVFNYTFKIYSNSDLDIYVTPQGQTPDDSTDLTNDYVVDPGTIGEEAGGFITFNSPLTGGEAVTIVSSIPYDRTVDYQNSGDFLPETVNNDNDRQVSQIKQILEQTGRTLQFQESQQGAGSLTLPNPVAANFLRWKSDLTGLENVELIDEALVVGNGQLLIFPTVAALKASTSELLVSGVNVETQGYYTAGDGGGAKYLIQTAAEYGGTPDGFGDHTLDNGNIAAIKNNLISPEQYGAVGDGVVDDTAPLLAYIEKTNDIFLTQGKKYQTTGLVISNKTDFRIFGKGALTIADAANKNVIEFFECERFSVKDIELDGNGDNQTELINRNNGCCVRFSLCKDWEISSTYCHDNYSGATILAIDNVTDATLLRTNGKILYNTIQNAGKVGGPLLSDGIFANSDNTQIEGNTISDCTDYGIAGDYSQYMSIKDNIITNVLIGIGALGAKFWEVSGNSINEAGQGIGVTLSGNPAVNPYLSENVKIHHNHITNITRDPSGTPNGDAIFVDPSSKYIETSFNTVDVAFRGIADSSIETMSAYNRVYNVADRPYFISGSGSWIQFNEWENAATGPLYGEVSNKTVLEKDHVSVTDATMQAPWVNFGGSRQDCGYYRQLGRVYLVGSATGGSTSTIFTLPAGYRPSHNMNFTVAAGLSDTAIITVNTEGAVIWLSGTATDVHLNSIQFIANGNIGL